MKNAITKSQNKTLPNLIRFPGMLFKRKIALGLLCMLLAGVLILFLYNENHNIQKTTYVFVKGLPAQIKILHISDLHGQELSRNNNNILSEIKKEDANLILLTGDFIDRDTSSLDKTAKLIGSINLLCPVFYIPGNHEYWYKNMKELKQALSKYNISMMQNEIRHITVKNQQINILGLDEVLEISGSAAQQSLFENLKNANGIKIVLSHYPENFALMNENSYCLKSFDFMFAGHAHGGQFILPFIGGIYSPGQGSLPKYYRGLHLSKINENKKDLKITTLEAKFSELRKGISYPTSPALIVSRGLGNSVIPQRLFNRPEIGVIIIK